MFVGEYLHTLDGKFRLMLPSKYQSQLAAGMVITKGLGASLRIFDNTAFEKRSQKIIELPTMDFESQKIRQYWFSNALDAIPDAQGRFVVPEKLRVHIGVQGGDEIAIVGSFDFIELFARAEWEKQAAVVGGVASADNSAMWAKYGI